MAEIVKQVDVLRSVRDQLKTHFSCPVRPAGNWPEKFKKPCFFVAATSRAIPKTVNYLEKELTIEIFFYAKDEEKNEFTYMEVVDRVQALFPVGIQTGGRFLKIESIEDDRVGEENDILLITITIPYVEKTGHSQGTAELMEEVDMQIIDAKQDNFPGTITKEDK